MKLFLFFMISRNSSYPALESIQVLHSDGYFRHQILLSKFGSFIFYFSLFHRFPSQRQYLKFLVSKFSIVLK